MEYDWISSRYVDLAGPVHVAELGGEGAPVVCVHGLGGSYANWAPAAGWLRRLGQVSAVDLPGFGLTPPVGRPTTLEANRRVLDRYLRGFDEPVTLIGNSMGGAIALRQAARAPETVHTLVLVSPAAPWSLRDVAPDPVVSGFFGAYATPGIDRLLMLGRRIFMSPEEVARWVLQVCAGDPEALAPEVVELHVRLAEQRRHIPGIDSAFLQAARSVVLTALRRAPYDRDVATVAVPTLVVHGEADRLVPCQAAVRLGELRPDWEVRILPDIGHIAMLEVPEVFGELVTAFDERKAVA